MTYSELNRDGEEVDTPKGLVNFITSGNTGKVNKGRFDDTFLAFDCVHSCQRDFPLRKGGKVIS